MEIIHAVTAAHRELLAETGLTAVLALDRVVEQVGADGAGVRFQVFTGRTDACQEDVIVGEGLAMRFLTHDEIARRNWSATPTCSDSFLGSAALLVKRLDQP